MLENTTETIRTNIDTNLIETKNTERLIEDVENVECAFTILQFMFFICNTLISSKHPIIAGLGEHL